MHLRSLSLQTQLRPGDRAALEQLSDRLWLAVTGVGPALLFNESGLDIEAPGVVAADVAVVVATSGSSGVPKLVQLSASALLASLEASANRIGSHRWLLALPAGYVAGLQVILRSRLAFETGCSPHRYPLALGPGFSWVDLAGIDSSVTAVSLVPYQLQQLLYAAENPAVAARARDFSVILLGGQAASAQLLTDADALGLRVVQSYGASETCGGCFYDGVALDGVRLRFQKIGEDSSGDALIEIGGATLFSGYLTKERPSDFPAEPDGPLSDRWWSSGDLGRLEQGRLLVTGRADRVFISGGFNVSLSRIESVIAALLPAATGFAVVSVPDRKWGQRAVLALSGERLSAQQQRLLNENLRQTLGVAAQLREVHHLDHLPRLASGKVDYRALSAEFSSSL